MKPDQISVKFLLWKLNDRKMDFLEAESSIKE